MTFPMMVKEVGDLLYVPVDQWDKDELDPHWSA
jgi:hypothetical protein